MADSPDLVVLGLSKKQLRAEVFRLVRELEKQVELKELAYKGWNDTVAAYSALIERNENRLDALSETHAQIIESRLGLTSTPTPTSETPPRPIGRKPWSQVANTFEKKQREEAKKSADERAAHWVKKIAEVEAKDKAEKP